MDISNYPEGNEFIKAITHAKYPETIDLRKLQVALDKFYKEKGKEQTAKLAGDKAEMVLFDILQHYDNDPFKAVSSYDPDNTGIISTANFYIRTKKGIRPDLTQADSTLIYNMIKEESDDYLRSFSLQMKLLKLNEKYSKGAANKVDAENFGNIPGFQVTDYNTPKSGVQFALAPIAVGDSYGPGQIGMPLMQSQNPSQLPENLFTPD